MGTGFSNQRPQERPHTRALAHSSDAGFAYASLFPFAANVSLARSQPWLGRLLAQPRWYQMVPKSGKLDPSRRLPSVATGPIDGARGKQWILGRLALIGLAGPGQKDIRMQCSVMRRGPGTRPDAVNHHVPSLARVNERSAGGWTANVCVWIYATVRRKMVRCYVDWLSVFPARLFHPTGGR